MNLNNKIKKSDLSPTVKKKALRGLRRAKKEVAGYVRAAFDCGNLSGAFSWARTKEGHDFWEEIYYAIREA